jgi:hypothetical protein
MFNISFEVCDFNRIFVLKMKITNNVIKHKHNQQRFRLVKGVLVQTRVLLQIILKQLRNTD